MNEIWPALFASAISATAALAGVAVSNIHNLRRHREVLREEGLKAQRELVVDALLAGREWAEMQLVLVPAMSKFTFEDLIEFADTDTGIRMRELTRELQIALTRSRLFLADNELRQVTAAMSSFIENFGESINGPILKEPGKVDHVVTGIGEVVHFRNSVRRLEQLAVERLPPPIWHSVRG